MARDGRRLGEGVSAALGLHPGERDRFAGLLANDLGERVAKLAGDIGLKNVYVAMNKISEDAQAQAIERAVERAIEGVKDVVASGDA